MLVIAIGASWLVEARAAEEDESLGKKFKDFFTAKPSPTPKRKKKTSTSMKKKAAPTSSPTPASPEPRVTPTPEPSVTVSSTPSETPRPRPALSITPRSSPKRTITPTPSAEMTPTPSIATTPTPSPRVKKSSAPNATISSDEISGYENYSEEVRKILDLALGLTGRDLGYKYGSADPANGGMDCSGFIHYVLSKSGFSEVPRDAREQYIWVRKAGNFQAVLGHSDDTFELDALKPGDLLFWAGTYNVDRDPAITHTMIYLGREHATNHRIMAGASDGRTYKGQSRFGVSVFDFKVSRLGSKTEDRPGPLFVGYGRIPGLRKE